MPKTKKKPPEVYEPFDALPQPNKRRSKGSTSRGNPLGPVRGSGRGFGDDAGDLFQGNDQGDAEEEQQTCVDSARRKNSDKERMDENWKKHDPKMSCDLLSMASQYALWHQEECAGKRASLQTRIDGAFKFHIVICDKCTMQPQVVGFYQATYIGVGFAFPLSIPIWSCFGCHQTFLPQPVHVGCFGSTPVKPHTWFDLKLFHQYAALFRHGTSCRAYVEGLNSSSCCFGVHGGHVVDPEAFQGAYLAFRRVTHQLISLEGLGVEIDSSPLRVCPICSPRPDEGDPYAVSLAMDAVNKCSHMAQAGNDVELEPHVRNFLGKGEEEVAHLEKKGCLDSIKTFKQHTSLLPQEGDDLEVSNCGSRLRCAREGSKATTIYDVNGLLGTTCAHGFALPNLFCNMRRSENFTFYLVLLKHIVKDCPSVKHVYIDFGCRLAKTWKWYLQALVEELPSSAADLRIMVNWMHGASHDMSCQIENSGRFQKYAGFVVGEQSEQLWSMTKEPSGPMRCMTLQNRHDSVKFLLSDLNDLKFTRLMTILETKMESMRNKLAELDKCLEGIRAESNAAGIQDLHAAAQEFLATQSSVSPSSSERPTLEAEYVRLREMEIAVHNLQSIGFTWKDAGGNSPAALLLRGSTHKEQRELRTKLADLEIKLGIAPDSVWTIDSDDYTRGYKLLAEQQILRCQSAIDVFVHELAQKSIEKWQQGEASKLTQALASKIRGLHTKLRSSLEETYAWVAAAEDDPDADVSLSKSVVGAMLQGEPAPWHVGSRSSGLRLILGRRFYMAENDWQRCKEQLSRLPVEKKRLVYWLEVVLQRVQEYICVVAEDVREHAFDGTLPRPYLLTRYHGEQFWLQWHAQRLAAILKDVNEKLKW